MGWLFGRMMTFEVEADEAPVSTAEVVADATGGLIELGEGRAIVGYAAHGSSIADAIRPLVEHDGLPLAERDGKLSGAAASEPVQLDANELGCDADGRDRPCVERLRRGDSSLPASQCIIYHDADRDFQAGQMRASSGGGGAVEERIEIPAVLVAAEAKQWAEQRLARKWQAASGVRLRLPPSRMEMKPGDQIRLPGSTRSMVVTSAEIDGMAVVIEAEAGAAEVAGLPADPGRTVPDRDEPIGRSEMALIELPAMGDLPEARPTLFAAASSGGRWKPVPVELWSGQQPRPGLALGRRAVLGTATTMLDHRMPLTLDLLSSVTVRLAYSDQLLLNADEDALTAGANLAMVGDELIQFGRAERLEHGRYRLSRLLRGRRGTEWAGANHRVGERFCLIDSTALAAIDLPSGTAGAVLRAVAHGIGDVAPLPEAQRMVSGEAIRPPSVCHLRARRDGESVRISWVRRSHQGWSWNDGVGVPADPFSEHYLVNIIGPEGELSLESDRPEVILNASALHADAGQPIEIEIRTVGPMALSRPRGVSITL
ncbi:phage tail protein [Sphingomonas sp. NSE70-1]|uniref:Phage tail protein n=1 Tax=Sphingomonas caseinilyticus TaxID=2908205 RepID=A0ABT0RX64_9SPHN|nr:phage tail protein [Sphingomonas caseinilyticus]MCL6699595.1 phage tail protein [Sphingomonas caseinilyticus]